MSIPTINITANVVAFYAAIMSTVIAVVQLSNYLRDRARLIVKVALRKVAISTDGKQYSVAPHVPVQGSPKLYVVINAVNRGRRPLKVTGWGGKYTKAHQGKKSFVVIPAGLPKILTEGDSLDEMTDEILENIDDVKSISMRDASGKEWKAPRSAVKKLKKDFHSLETKNSSGKAAQAGLADEL